MLTSFCKQHLRHNNILSASALLHQQVAASLNEGATNPNWTLTIQPIYSKTLIIQAWNKCIYKWVIESFNQPIRSKTLNTETSLHPKSPPIPSFTSIIIHYDSPIDGVNEIEWVNSGMGVDFGHSPSVFMSESLKNSFNWFVKKKCWFIQEWNKCMYEWVTKSFILPIRMWLYLLLNRWITHLIDLFKIPGMDKI